MFNYNNFLKFKLKMKEDNSNKEKVLSLFDCPSCKLRFDDITKRPILLACGVTICSKCINEILKSKAVGAPLKSSYCPFHKDCNTDLDKQGIINRLVIEM